MEVDVKIRGLDELQKKLKGSVLYEDEMEAGLETIGQRLERQGKGLGAKRNEINRVRSEKLQHRVMSTRVWPRTTGAAWTRKQQSVFKSMSPRVVNKVIKRIRERWAS